MLILPHLVSQPMVFVHPILCSRVEESIPIVCDLFDGKKENGIRILILGICFPTNATVHSLNLEHIFIMSMVLDDLKSCNLFTDDYKSRLECIFIICCSDLS